MSIRSVASSHWWQFLMNIKGMSVAKLLREVIVAVNYEEYLKESQKDWIARFVARMSSPRTTQTHETRVVDGRMSRSLSPTQRRASLSRTHLYLRILPRLNFPCSPNKSCGLPVHRIHLTLRQLPSLGNLRSSIWCLMTRMRLKRG